tara:strand:+ start:2330 stop:3445 length:1116 start_codon:yes stop_codon:yes gene_type:complete
MIFNDTNSKLNFIDDLNTTNKLLKDNIIELNSDLKINNEFGLLYNLSKDYFDEGILFLDSKRNVKSINKKALELFDINISNIPSINKLTDISTNIEILEFVESSSTNVNNKNIQTNFPEKHFNLRSLKIEDTIILFIKDITDIFYMDKIRKEFFANTSHELKTPVTSIQLNVEALKNSIKIDNKDDFEYFLEKITFDSDRLQKISKDIGNVHALESGIITLSEEEFSIDDFINEAKKLIETLLDSKQIKLIINKKNNFKKIVLDRNLFMTIFENVISNSIRYSEIGNSIEIDLFKSEKEFEIVFNDYGTGVTKKDLPHIFERFYRADGIRSDKHSGLGLSIVKHIVELHDGTIIANSSLNNGLSIAIKIPQ